MGNMRRRVRSVPSVALATPVSRAAPSAPDASSDSNSTAAAIDTFQRSFDAVAQAAQKAASHPTLRDALVPCRLTNGVNKIVHGISRLPRFVYVTFLDMGESWVTWWWQRQSGDADRDFVQIDLNSDPTVGGFVGHGGGDSPPTSVGVGIVSLPALVRIE